MYPMKSISNVMARERARRLFAVMRLEKNLHGLRQVRGLIAENERRAARLVNETRGLMERGIHE